MMTMAKKKKKREKKKREKKKREKKKREKKKRRRKSQKQKPRQKRYGFGNISMINPQSGLGIRARLRRKNIINSFRVLAAKRTVAMTHLCHGFIFVQKGK